MTGVLDTQAEQALDTLASRLRRGLRVGSSRRSWRPLYMDLTTLQTELVSDGKSYVSRSLLTTGRHY